MNNLLNTLIKENCDDDGTILIRRLTTLYERNTGKVWSKVCHLTATKYLEKEDGFKVIKVGPGKHRVTIDSDFVPAKNPKDKSEESKKDGTNEAKKDDPSLGDVKKGSKRHSSQITNVGYEITTEDARVTNRIKFFEKLRNAEEKPKAEKPKFVEIPRGETKVITVNADEDDSNDNEADESISNNIVEADESTSNKNEEAEESIKNEANEDVSNDYEGESDEERQRFIQEEKKRFAEQEEQRKRAQQEIQDLEREEAKREEEESKKQIPQVREVIRKNQNKPSSPCFEEKVKIISSEVAELSSRDQEEEERQKLEKLNQSSEPKESFQADELSTYDKLEIASKEIRELENRDKEEEEAQPKIPTMAERELVKKDRKDPPSSPCLEEKVKMVSSEVAELSVRDQQEEEEEEERRKVEMLNQEPEPKESFQCDELSTYDKLEIASKEINELVNRDKEEQGVQESEKEEEVETFTVLFQVQADYDYTTEDPEELPFSEGDIMDVIADEGDWLEACRNGQQGFIPANYVKRI